jgi:transposase
MWVPPEVRDPVLLHAPTRKSTACFGAVSLSTGQFVWTTCKVFNNQTFAAFLTQLLRHRRRGKRMVVVLDNARYHHAVLLAPLLDRYRGCLTLFFLPPYSPQLAPIERVWKLTRRLVLHNRYFATLPEVLEAVVACFKPWAKANQILRRLCCIT